MRKSLVYARNIAITIVVLALIAVGAGAAYVWWSGNQAPAPNAFAEPVETTQRSTTRKKPVVPENPKEPIGVFIQSLTSPIAPGDNAAVAVRSGVGATCAIVVEYNKVKSTDSGLIEKPVDDYGMVNWSWTLEENVPLGTWPVTITCKRGEMSAVMKGNLEVKNRADITE